MDIHTILEVLGKKKWKAGLVILNVAFTLSFANRIKEENRVSSQADMGCWELTPAQLPYPGRIDAVFTFSLKIGENI